ncbi:DUF2147 domain-containing protein [Tellurirhabdus bombi]|uniref:DUF2147 domain-containing protein n=1 Tax=Tellurirhabdus bombi TaxID=2907205 RepID=UPI001F1EC56E|nr:DUF2147 domain-containing protein [Tellurirhabdus bombi]
MTLRWLVAAIVLVTIQTAYTPKNTNPDAVVGTWLNGTKRGHIQIYKQGNKYFGKLIWLKDPNDPATNKPKTDTKNPNPALRNRALMGLDVMKGFIYDGDNVWDEGKIYNPEDGKEYSCKMTLKNANTLDVRGFIGISLLGKTQTWTKVQ